LAAYPGLKWPKCTYDHPVPAEAKPWSGGQPYGVQVCREHISMCVCGLIFKCMGDMIIECDKGTDLMKKINSKVELSQCLSITVGTGRKGSAPTNLYEFIFTLWPS